MFQLILVLILISPIFLWAGVLAGKMTRRRVEHHRDK